MSLYSPKDFLSKGIQIKEGAFVVMVKTEWNSHIIDELEAGCIRVFNSLNIKYQTLIVPGAVEIPFAIKNYWEHHSTSKPDAFIALGCVIRGGTPHFDYVCKFVTEGILQLNLSNAAPTIFGVLTVDNESQAMERIGGIHGHKGEEAAEASIKMIALMQSIKNNN